MADAAAHPDPETAAVESTGSAAEQSAAAQSPAPAKRVRRRAGAPAGAPVSTQSEVPAAEAPRTSVPEQSASAEAAPSSPAPRRRRRASAPAGAPADAPITPRQSEPSDPAPSASAASNAPETDEHAPAPAADAAAQTASEPAGAEPDRSAIAADLRALADAHPQAEAETEPDEDELARREQVRTDFASLLFQAPVPARRRTTVGPDVDEDDDEDETGDSAEDATREADGQSATEESGSGRSRSRRSRRSRSGRGGSAQESDGSDDADARSDSSTGSDADSDSEDDGQEQGSGASGAGEEDGERGTPRRRRRRGGRGRRGRGRTDEDRRGDSGEQSAGESDASGGEPDSASEEGHEQDGDSEREGEGSTSSRRRRRRRRSGSSDPEVSSPDDPPNTVVKVREGRDEVKAVKGSTRLEAKKQRRREGRDAGRRRTVITEAEFLARRESVKRSMVVRERPGRTQIAVLEDDVLVEHYVAQKSQTSMVGNVYLGKVQNVLPSMEAAFIDIGRGRNAVLYAGEVNWDAAGLEGQPRRIELALKSGDAVLVQVTKDPIGHKGARLTSQISLPGRYVVFVPGGSMTGISRKLPDTERARLKKIMRQIIPEDAGVIVRTAAEGASEEELTRDVERLRGQWEKIQKSQKSKSAPIALSQEPDLAIKVVRDVFNEDFTSLIVEGERVHDEVHEYVSAVAPDLLERVTRHVGPKDVFAKHRIDEQLLKAMDRKVYLPSGGSLVIDRTEAMTVVDVNTGKFTGSGGSLEETVTRNNLEAAEEIVRQLRLRDIGGIIVIDFIDMVLESNRDLVLRRLVECLGRDRTKHQVAEVTSLGLVQMTRKRVGQGLVETFSHSCEACSGRGLVVDLDGEPAPAAQQNGGDEGPRSKRRSRRSRSGSKDSANEQADSRSASPDVHRLEDDEDSRALARATIASIAAASTGQNAQPEVTVDGEVVKVEAEDESAESGPAAQA